MKKRIKYISLLFIIIACSITSVIAQDAEPTDIYLEFSTWKYNDLSRSLIVKITAENEEGEYFPQDVPVIFFSVDEEGELLLGETLTDENGLAELNMPDGSVAFPKDEDGHIHFVARFIGNDLFFEAEEEILVKDVVISISFVEEGEEKLVYFEGIILGEEDLPLPDDDLFFYVPRMFSDMKIADGWFEEDGTGYVEFPPNIIGDSVGNVLVIARLEDHYDYGNVEVFGETGWGIPKRLISAEGPSRELWTPIAPLWMIITLIIMLTGVWAHYIYAVIQLIKIKKSKS